MVTVIRDLIVHLSRLRIHLVQPLETPINLIHDVRNPVTPRSPVSQMVVRECLRVALVSEHHLVNGVCRGGRVLKTVRSVVPSARHVKKCAIFLRVRMSDDNPVLAVTAVLEERIPAATLLAHIVQNEISGPVINLFIYREYLRTGLTTR